MQDAKSILEVEFGGNISRAAEVTGISRASWHAWKKAGFPNPMPEKLELWLLRNQQPGHCTDGPTPRRPD